MARLVCYKQARRRRIVDSVTDEQQRHWKKEQDKWVDYFLPAPLLALFAAFQRLTTRVFAPTKASTSRGFDMVKITFSEELPQWYWF